jgi:hypothetical protein
MPAIETKKAPTYLREARLSAGYANRDTASTVIPYAPETIGRHERGEVSMSPEDVLMYAQYYHRDDITIRYCADCPVGRATGKTATDRDLPCATMRLTQRLRRAAKEIAATLEAIADDGIIDEQERPIFDASLVALHELGETISDIELYSATQGIKRRRPPQEKEQPSTTIASISVAASNVKHFKQEKKGVCK